MLRAQEAAAGEQREQAEARLHEQQEQLATLDEQRRAAQDDVGREAAALAEPAPGWEPCARCRRRCRPNGKLEPWLRRHGLESLAGLWTQVHIDSGWETGARSRAARAPERAGRSAAWTACAPSPPTRRRPSWRSTRCPRRRRRARTARCRRWPTAAAGRRGARALLADWLEGVYTAESMDEALAGRTQLTQGEVVMTREGHAVSQHAVSFYAPDSEQAGMLARAQEIENLDRQQRAQSLIADEAKGASVRLEAAYTDAAQRLAGARREAAEAQNRAHQLQVELLRLSSRPTPPARAAATAQELAEIDAELEALAERRAMARAASRSSTATSARRRNGMPSWKTRSSPPSAGWPTRASSSARWNARHRRRSSRRARWRRAATSCNAASRPPLRRWRANTQASEQLELELGTLDDAAAQAGLQTALALRLEREQALAAARSTYDDLSARCARPTSSACGSSAAWTRCASASASCSSNCRPRGSAVRSTRSSWVRPASTWSCWRNRCEEGGVRLAGLQAEIDRIQREVRHSAR
jgi:chromosome segregation protein